MADRELAIPDGTTHLLHARYGVETILPVQRLLATQAVTAYGRWNRRTGLSVGVSSYRIDSVRPATAEDITRVRNAQRVMVARERLHGLVNVCDDAGLLETACAMLETPRG